MSKKNLKLWFIYISVVLFILCCFIGASSILSASAEENASKQIQVYEDKIQSEDTATSTFEKKDSSNKDIYKNLGSKRLSEGEQGLSQLHYIENANYFLANPYHRENYDTTGDHPFGTCTTVAHQLLLGYHNYYSDRRLIPEISSDGKRYLSENYGDLNLDPVLVYGPSVNDLGRTNIGTTDEVFYGIFNKAGGDSLLSQTIDNVAIAADGFLENCAGGRTKNWTITYSGYNKQKVMEELDAGRPVIVGFYIFGGHSSHVIVAYGYATYNDELCYITHYGWGKEDVQMLVPESWLGYQVTMKVDHEHDFIDTGKIIKHTYRALNCTTCGCSKVDEMYSLNEAGNIITGCKYDLEGEVTIPSKINGQTIIGIAANAFADQTDITEIEIPNTIENIGTGILSGCDKLVKISIPFIGGSRKAIVNEATIGYIFGENFFVGGTNTNQNGRIYCIPNSLQEVIVTDTQTIGDYAFCNCDKLIKISLSNNVTKIGDSAFLACSSLQSVNIPNSVEVIGEYTFYGCENLNNVQLSNSLVSIGSNAFEFCTSLESIKIPNSITEIKNNTFSFCNKLNNVTLPNSLTKIGKLAFSSTGLTNIQIPDSVTFIGDSAFALCVDLRNITLPNNISYFGEGIFINCNSLEDIILPESLTNIPEHTFFNCSSLTEIIIPYGIKNIGKEAFRNCNGLISIELPYMVESIGEGAFKDCSGLISCSVLHSEAKIGKEVFSGCTNLTEVSFPLYGITEIGEGAFRDCINLTTIRLPDSLTSIEAYLFYGCASLTDIKIVSDVMSIGDYAFYGCGIESIVIPDNVMSIGENVFADSCLKEIEVVNTNPNYTSQNGVLYNKEKTLIISVPQQLEGGILLPEGVKTIEESAFSNRTKLTSITIPDSVISIGNDAFKNCDALTIYVETVTSERSGWGAAWNSSARPIVWGCTLSEEEGYIVSFSKTSSSISNSGAEGGISAPYRESFEFEGWGGEPDGIPLFTLKDITDAPNMRFYAIWVDLEISNFRFNLINSGTEYEVAVKSGKTVTGDIIIPAVYKGLPVTKIADYGFADNTYVNAHARTDEIITVSIPESIINIGQYAFNNCRGIIEVIFADNSRLQTIESSAFSHCTELQNITIPKTVTNISSLAFLACENLESVTFEAGSQLETIGNNAFDSCISLSSISLPESITNLGTFVFENCKGLTTINLPHGITEIPNGLFCGCSLTEITLMDTIESIGDNAFSFCQLFRVDIPASITYIAESAFSDCNITSLVVSSNNTVYESKNNCLIRKSDKVLLCGSNKSIIPDYVTSIGNYADRKSVV